MLVWDNVLLLLAATKNNREREFGETFEGALATALDIVFWVFFKSVNSLEEFVVSLGKGGGTWISLYFPA